MNTQNQTAIQDKKPADTSDADAKRKALEANVTAEHGAYVQTVADTLTNAQNVKPMVLDRLAQAYGESAGTKGRPSMEAYIPFILAILGAEVSAPRRRELALKANAAQKAKWGSKVGDGKFITVCTEAAKGSAEGNVKASITFRKPAAFEIAAA